MIAFGLCVLVISIYSLWRTWSLEDRLRDIAVGQHVINQHFDDVHTTFQEQLGLPDDEMQRLLDETKKHREATCECDSCKRKRAAGQLTSVTPD